MRKILVTSILSAFAMLMSSQTTAATLSVSAGQFDYEISGTIKDDATDVVNLDSDLGMIDDDTSQLYAYIEHPIPLVPNFRVGKTDLDLSGSGTTPGFTFNGVTYGAENMTTDLDLSHNEVALYWGLPVPAIDINLGVNVKFFDGGVTLTGSTSGTTTELFDETVPMFYAAVNIPIAGTGFNIAADYSTIEDGDDSFTDYLVRVRYEADAFWGLEYGIRNLEIDYTDGTEALDIAIDGEYIAFYLHF